MKSRDLDQNFDTGSKDLVEDLDLSTACRVNRRQKLEHNNPQFSQHKHYNECLEGLDIDLKEDAAVHVFQGCDIKNCYIRIRSGSVSAQHVLSGNRWRDCVFHPARELSMSTVEADFYNCKFRGKWSGRIKGSVEGCDFTDAHLINVAFYGIQTPGSNKFSSDDTVIIENAGANRQEIKRLLADKSNLWLHIRPEVGLFVFSLSRQKDPAALKEALQGLSYVRFE